MAKQHRRTWQRHEQAVARALGTERSAHWPGPTGGPDVSTHWLAAECKSWARLPARVVAALEQAERSANSEQLPIAVLHEVGKRREDNIVVLRWSDFLEWFGAGTASAGE